MNTIKLPADVVLTGVLQTVRALGECCGDSLAQLATEYYPVPNEQGENVITHAYFLNDTDEIELVYGPADDDWTEIGEDEEDDSYKFQG